MTDNDETEKDTAGVPPPAPVGASEDTPGPAEAQAPVLEQEELAAPGEATPAGDPGPLAALTPPLAEVAPARPAAAHKAAGRHSAPRKSAAAPATKRAASSLAPAGVAPLKPTTLAIDVGGTGLKASVLDAEGKLVANRVRVVTPYPCTPKALIDALAGLIAPLPAFDRVSVGFPGVVRKGIVWTAPHFFTKTGVPGEAPVAKLVAAWNGFDLAGALANRFGHAVRVANDADLQGLDVVSGSGLEFVVTLGTGVGTALFLDGKLAPHLELAHHPFRRGQTYDEQLGDTPLRRIGAKKWRKRLDEALFNFHGLLNYDRLYIGGGNARLLAGHVDPSVTIVDNLAGILGGIKLWELDES